MYPVFNICLRQTRYCQVSNLVIFFEKAAKNAVSVREIKLTNQQS